MDQGATASAGSDDSFLCPAIENHSAFTTAISSTIILYLKGHACQYCSGLLESMTTPLNMLISSANTATFVRLITAE
jgi:hypothetical protein